MNRNNLMDLFSETDKQTLIENTTNNKKILIFDTTNIVYRTLYGAIFSNPEDNISGFYLWRHTFLNSIFNTISMFNPEKVILCFDSRPSWRYSIFSEYKAKRKLARDKSVVDFEKFFPVLEKYISQIKEVFSKTYVLSVPKCESDDIIAILSKEIFKNKEVIIISGDSDMNQLINSNIKQYDPMKKKFVENINPERELQLKVITGDKSDNIPPIKKKVGIVTANKILDSGLDDYLKESKEIKANFIRNKTLIDFNYIPKEISQNIINTYNNYKLNDMESKKILNFFIENKLMKLMQSWETFSDKIKSLV